MLERRVSTNHQRRVEWQRHAETTRTVERAAALEQAVALSSDPQGVLAAFLQPPVYQTSYGHGYGTLYTAFYRPQDASVELIWPGQSWRQSCAHVQEGMRTIRFTDESPAA